MLYNFQEYEEMTFDLILSSLLYHGREWFVFQDILTHLPPEKVATATQRSKTTSEKYTYRFGITRDWVTGDGKKILVDRHFIDSNDSGRSLVFSSVLIDASRVQELFLESFNKRFRLKVQQFHLTATSLDSAWFEWHFDPKQKDGSPVKKTKLTVEENNRQSSKTSGSDNENLTPNKSHENRPTPLAVKRRRPASESGDQANSNYSPTISESVLMRPRKKAKEANLSICKYLDEQETKPDIEHKEEPMSPDYKPDLANFHIKKSASPIDEPKVKLSPSSSPQTIVKDDVMLSSITNNTCSDTDYIPQSSDKTQETCTTPHASNETSLNSDDLNEKENSAISDSANDDLCQDGIDHDDLCQDEIDHDDLCQDEIDLDDQGDLGNMADNEHGETGSISETVGNMLKNTSNISDNNSTIDYTNSTDSSNNDSNIPDSNVPDDLHPDPQNDQPTSPISPSVDNAKNIMENINLQKQELCAEEESVGVNGRSSEAQSSLADTSTSSESHKHDCGAEACTSNGASSTVCLCTNEEKSKKETSLERFGSTGIS